MYNLCHSFYSAAAYEQDASLEYSLVQEITNDQVIVLPLLLLLIIVKPQEVFKNHISTIQNFENPTRLYY